MTDFVQANIALIETNELAFPCEWTASVRTQALSELSKGRVDLWTGPLGSRVIDELILSADVRWHELLMSLACVMSDCPIMLSEPRDEDEEITENEIDEMEAFARATLWLLKRWEAMLTMPRRMSTHHAKRVLKSLMGVVTYLPAFNMGLMGLDPLLNGFADQPRRAMTVLGTALRFFQGGDLTDLAESSAITFKMAMTFKRIVLRAVHVALVDLYGVCHPDRVDNIVNIANSSLTPKHLKTRLEAIGYMSWRKSRKENRNWCGEWDEGSCGCGCGEA